MFAIVEQQQGLSGTEDVGELVGNRLVGSRNEGQGGRDRHGHQVGVGQRREIDPDHAVRKMTGHVCGEGEGEPGLPNSTGAGQRQQRDGLIEQERPRRRSLRLATDQPGAGNGKRSEPGRGDWCRHTTSPT